MRSTLIFLPLLAFVVIGCGEQPRPTRSANPRSATAQTAQLAPEIEGEDVDGKYFKLSEHKGKVVLLEFSGEMCPACQAFQPRGQAIVKKNKGRPFVLLGVSTDRESNASTCSRWRVEYIPTFYIIDANGVIRDRIVGLDPTLEKRVEELVKEAESKV